MVFEFMEELDGNTLTRNTEDERAWCDDDTQEYRVKSTYTKLKIHTSLLDKFRYDVF